jgi:tryptophanyl-tRNA synthetase
MSNKNIVNPYEVKGNVNYNKLIDEFGLERIDECLLNRIKKYTHDLHPMLTRKIFFAHRDLNWLLDDMKKE